MTWTVYALREPGLVEARYVGPTQALRNRASQHRTMWRRMPQPSEFAAWLRASNFDLVELSGHDTEKDARAAERQAVRTLSALGHRLFNHWLLPADKRVPRRSIPITRAPSQRVPKVPGAFRGSGDGGL